ncbi:MAG: FadD3 family acyl-CoA ligase [Cellvibrionales bacterium]|nr:FadD3 family acyl-CoA ligase [Cellvibrionales bacterium]
MATSSEYLTVPSLLESLVARFKDKVAIREGELSLSYIELSQEVNKAAKSFVQLGLTKGDKAAIWAPNISEWIIAALGLEVIGAVLVPLNTRMKGSEAADIINRSQSKVVLSVAEFQTGPETTIKYFDMLEGQDLPAVIEKISFKGEKSGVVNWQHFLQLGIDVSDDVVHERMQSVSANDTMDMLFTSGTTGKPKGVMCAHEQNIRTVTAWADINGLNENDNYLIINPFFHSFGYKAGWLAALIKGATIYPVLIFDLDAVLQQIQDDKISMLPGPPTIYQSILAHPDREKYDLSSLRLAVTGAAPVPVSLIDRMRNELNFESVVTAYGLTETCGFVSICRPDDPAEVISGSSGRAMDGIDIKCVDSDGLEVPRGEPGEIWVRGYNVMQGYFENEQATQDTITEDGWLKTGDIGVMDANGYIDITDRMKDMYISGGFNVYPAEIENCLSAIEGIVQLAVIGVADERMGEVGKVFCVKQSDAGLTEADVIGFAKQHLANYKVPRSVVFLDAMPMNASGKILKNELREA